MTKEILEAISNNLKDIAKRLESFDDAVELVEEAVRELNYDLGRKLENLADAMGDLVWEHKVSNEDKVNK